MRQVKFNILFSLINSFTIRYDVFHYIDNFVRRFIELLKILFFFKTFKIV